MIKLDLRFFIGCIMVVFGLKVVQASGYQACRSTDPECMAHLERQAKLLRSLHYAKWGIASNGVRLGIDVESEANMPTIKIFIQNTENRQVDISTSGIYRAALMVREVRGNSWEYDFQGPQCSAEPCGWVRLKSEEGAFVVSVPTKDVGLQLGHKYSIQLVENDPYSKTRVRGTLELPHLRSGIFQVDL